MEKLAGAYIKKKINTARTKSSDSLAVILSNNSGKSQAELAQDWAAEGHPDLTASILYRKPIPLSQKGEILAHAYATRL